MLQLSCSQIWGGIEHADTDLYTASITASLYAQAADGSKGGDIHYLSICGEGLQTRIAVADVTGHGAAVSDVSTWMYDALADHLNSPDDHRVLERLNRAALAHGLEAMATAAVVSIYAADGRLHFSYAGHPPIYLKRADSARWYPAALRAPSDPGNLPLGVLEGVVYDREGLALAPGDKAVLYTDGVIEALDAKGRPFGEQRLEDALNAAAAGEPSEIKSAVLDAIERHRNGHPPHDDVTLMVFQINGA